MKYIANSIEKIFHWLGVFLRVIEFLDAPWLKRLFHWSRSLKHAPLLVLVIVLFASLPSFASANFVVEVILSLILWLTGIFAYFFAWLGNFIEVLINVNLDVLTLFRQGNIDEGWRIVRDTVNMGFILILLFVAFATVLQIQSWNYRSVLPRFIAAVLLVNFSQVIAEFVIGVGNQVFRGFLNAAGGAAGFGNLVAFVGNASSQLSASLSTSAQDATNVIEFSQVFSIVGTLVGIVVMIRFAMTLLVRVIALWTLIVVSPAAFLALAAPPLRQYFDKWLSLLFKHVFVGPIAMFLFVLAVRLSFSGLEVKPPLDDPAGLRAAELANYSIAVRYLVALGFMWMAGSVTKSVAGKAGDLGVNLTKKGVRFAGRSGLRGIRFGGGLAREGVERQASSATSSAAWRGTAAALNIPSAISGALADRRKKVESRRGNIIEDIKSGRATAPKILQNFVRNLGQRTSLDDVRSDNSRLKQKEKDFEDEGLARDPLALVDRLFNYIDERTGRPSDIAAVSALLNIAEKNKLRPYVESAARDRKDSQGNPLLADNENILHFIHRTIGQEGVSPERARQVSNIVSGTGASVGDYELSAFLQTNGDLRSNSDNNDVKDVMAAFKRLLGQLNTERLAQLDVSTYFKVDQNGEVVINDQTNLPEFRTLSEDGIDGDVALSIVLSRGAFNERNWDSKTPARLKEALMKTPDFNERLQQSRQLSGEEFARWQEARRQERADLNQQWINAQQAQARENAQRDANDELGNVI